MDEELRRLVARAERIARAGERLSAQFAAELSDIWLKTERALSLLIREQPSASTAAAAIRAVALKARIRGILEQSGYDLLIPPMVQSMATAYVGLAAVGVGAGAVAGASTDILAALQRLAAVNLLAQGDEAATNIWRGLVQQVLSKRAWPDILAGLQSTLDRTQAHVRTLFDTQTSIFGRQVEAIATQHLGPTQPFLFVGPIDAVTREFCLDRVGKVYSRAVIDDMDNGQLPECFLTGGGYNCRHSWLAVESNQLRALSDTGERVPTIQANLDRLAQWKQQQQHAKQAARASVKAAPYMPTEADINTVQRYTGGAYKDINNALREGRPLTAQQQVDVNVLDRLIKTAPKFDEPVDVYRGLGIFRMPPGDVGLIGNREQAIRNWVADQAAAKFPIGSTVQLGGFQSTSRLLEPALDAAGSRNSPGVILRIKARQGLDISHVSRFNDEAEVLLSRSTRYRVLGITPQEELELLDGSKVIRTVVDVAQIK